MSGTSSNLNPANGGSVSFTARADGGAELVVVSNPASAPLETNGYRVTQGQPIVARVVLTGAELATLASNATSAA